MKDVEAEWRSRAVSYVRISSKRAVQLPQPLSALRGIPSSSEFTSLSESYADCMLGE